LTKAGKITEVLKARDRLYIFL